MSKNQSPLASAAAAHAKNPSAGIDHDAARRIMDAMSIRCFASLAAAAAKLEPAELATIGELLAQGSQTARSQGKPKTAPSYANKKQLLASMAPIVVVIDGAALKATPRDFSTGSVGYFLNGKSTINGEMCQINCTITVIGSKGLPTG
jgi:hypothetical protein